MTKRELVLKAIRQEKVERVPVGFWFHFLDDQRIAEPSEKNIQQNIEGHREFIEAFQPDFVKLMSDGYFYYPNEVIKTIEKAEDLKKIKPIADDNPWYEGQVNLIKQQTNQFVEEIASFYNIFAPATYFKWQLPGGEKQLADLLIESPELVEQALNIIADDIAKLVSKILAETTIDGIYLSVQNLQDKRVTKESYIKNIQPSELKVLEVANEAKGINILHICGYEGAKNDLSIFQNYPAAAINWAVGPEKLSLSEGQKFFNKPVIGGFNNTVNGVLYRGTPEEIKDATIKLLEETGTNGVIIGADCTVPSDISLENLELVRQASSKFEKQHVQYV